MVVTTMRKGRMHTVFSWNRQRMASSGRSIFGELRRAEVVRGWWRRLAPVVVAGILGLFFPPDARCGPQYQVLTEELPPFSFMENDKATGLCTEIVRAVLQKMHHADKIDLNSWSRGYNLTLQNEGYILFSTIRTESREKLFKWVGPIITDRTVLFAKKGSGLVIRSLDDAKKVKSIGTYKDDVGEALLREKGFTNFSSILDDKFNVQKLVAGRIDLWINGNFTGPYIARKLGLEDQIEIAFEIGKDDMFMAFNKNTPDEEIVLWQKALDEVKAEPMYGQILRKYGIQQ